MKKLLIAVIALGTLSAFAGEDQCDKALAQTQHISNYAGKWDYKLQLDIAENEYAETIESSRLRRDAYFELAEVSKMLTKAICRL